MAWRESARWSGAALAVLCVSAVGTVRPASAQEIERVLVGVRLGSRGTTVLAKYGNPNNVVIGDIGVRQAPLSLTPTNANGQPNSPGGLPNMPGGAGFPGAADPDMEKGNMQAGMRGGGPMGFPGGPGAFPGIPGVPNGAPNGLSGIPGGGPEDMNPGGGMNGNSSFGQTVSPLAREQEVTWVYNRKVGTNVVSYEFLIGPSGDVSQIVVSGYTGGNARTRKGIVLGSTYKDVVRVYGYPEDHEQVGNVLIASYKQKAHVSFQFLDQPSLTSAFDQGNKVIAITIATVE